jgi:V/A-type H+/Na+-transporting ATPase subunit E
VLAEMSGLNRDEKARIYSRILAKGTKVIPKCKVYCPIGESKLVASSAGIIGVVETDMGSGLVLESGDGLVRLDYRFRTVLEGVWEKELKNVSDILFG